MQCKTPQVTPPEFSTYLCTHVCRYFASQLVKGPALALSLSEVTKVTTLVPWTVVSIAAH